LLPVFSTSQSPEDVLKLMPGRPKEFLMVGQAKTFVSPVLAYASTLANKDKPLTPDASREIVSIILKILDSLVHGEFSFDPKTDWIAKAQTTAPASLSSLFEGEPEEEMQNCYIDGKLLDALYSLTRAAYTRTHPNNPWTPALVEPMSVVKLATVAIQRLCADNLKAQEYICHRKLADGTFLLDDMLQVQLPDPLGSAITIAK